MSLLWRKLSRTILFKRFLAEAWATFFLLTMTPRRGLKVVFCRARIVKAESAVFTALSNTYLKSTAVRRRSCRANLPCMTAGIASLSECEWVSTVKDKVLRDHVLYAHGLRHGLRESSYELWNHECVFFAIYLVDMSFSLLLPTVVVF